MAALVLGLLISSAMGSFDRINNELVENAARTVSLDRLLAEYGPQTRELRELIKRDYTIKVDLLTSGDATQVAKLQTPEAIGAMQGIQAKLWRLAPRDEAQRGLHSRALQISGDLASARVLVLLQKDGSIPMRLLAVLVAWLVIIFAAFGLCAPRNYTGHWRTARLFAVCVGSDLSDPGNGPATRRIHQDSRSAAASRACASRTVILTSPFRATKVQAKPKHGEVRLLR